MGVGILGIVREIFTDDQIMCKLIFLEKRTIQIFQPRFFLAEERVSTRALRRRAYCVFEKEKEGKCGWHL